MHGFQAALRRLWRRRGWLNYALLPDAGLFAAGVGLRRFAYRMRLLPSWRAPVPVVVVGCITAGGGGKTPTVMALARQLREQGLQPGIVSRGYGRTGTDVALVKPDSDVGDVGDEPLLLHQATGVPVAVGADRPAAARMLLEHAPATDVIISDDGLQHYALRRNVEIAVIAADFGLGNGWLLPAGPLREGPSRLKQVDWVVRSGGPPQPGEHALELQDSKLCDLDGAAVAAADLAAGTVAAVAGIADPAAFFAALRAAGVTPASEHVFPDHHRYAPADLAGIKTDWIATTAKDALKFPRDAGPRVVVLRQYHALEPRLIDSLVQRLQQA